MRVHFTDAERIQRVAKRRAEGKEFSVRRWWANKYKRPANDPRFGERSFSVWIQEMYEDLYDRKIELTSQLSDASRHEERREISGQLRDVCKALGEIDASLGEDPLIDKWERELEDGVDPDLDEDIDSEWEKAMGNYTDEDV